MPKGNHAWLFPGQGAHNLHMLAPVRNLDRFKSRYERICCLTGSFPLAELNRGNIDYLNRNVISSLLTVLVSTLSLDLLREAQRTEPDFVAGYSVGQWTAMYAAGALSFDELILVVKARAEMMDDCVSRYPSTGMLAVIGLHEEALTDIVAEVMAEIGGEEVLVDGEYLSISNFNCLGQYSLSGTEIAIRMAQERIARLKPKKMVRLPVSGPWHCTLLLEAAGRFEAFLKNVSLDPFRYPVMDNVTGAFLPMDAQDLRRQLARHICRPVQWERGMRTLIDAGCLQFIEVGHGNMLTKFGFFINRRLEYKSFYIALT